MSGQILDVFHLRSINKAMIATAHGAEYRIHYVSADGTPFGICRTFFTREALRIAFQKERDLDDDGAAAGPHIISTLDGRAFELFWARNQHLNFKQARDAFRAQLALEIAAEAEAFA